MTKDEAEVVAAVLATADGGCQCCAERLAEKMQEKFPGFNWWAMVREAGRFDD